MSEPHEAFGAAMLDAAEAALDERRRSVDPALLVTALLVAGANRPAPAPAAPVVVAPYAPYAPVAPPYAPMAPPYAPMAPPYAPMAPPYTPAAPAEPPEPAAPADLFDAFAGPAPGPRRRYERYFEVVARPGEALAAGSLRPGDLLLRRAYGEGGMAHAAVLAGGELVPAEGLAAAGLTPRDRGAGLFAPVVEAGPSPARRGDGVARRLADASGRLATDSLVLRPRSGRLGAGEAAFAAFAGGEDSGAAISGSAFPFSAVQGAIVQGGPKGQQTLGISDALAAARAAKKIDPKLKIAVFDMTDGGMDYGGLDDEDMVFTASLNKIAALAAAFALREALIAAVQGVTATTAADLLAAVEAAWGAVVRKRFGKRPADFPKLRRIFDLTPPSPPAASWSVKFQTGGQTQTQLEALHDTPAVSSLRFFERMLLMAQFSDNLGAGGTIQDLGFQYIMGTMADLGFYAAAADQGLWLAKDYAGGHWGAVPSFSGQRANARSVAKYFAALGGGRLVNGGVSAEMRSLLDAHWTRSFIEEGLQNASPSASYAVHAAKIGLYEVSDLPAKFGPADEGGYFERAAGGKTLRYALALLSGSIAGLQGAARLVDEVILQRNTP